MLVKILQNFQESVLIKDAVRPEFLKSVKECYLFLRIVT